jgi:hypothetical protein
MNAISQKLPSAPILQRGSSEECIDEEELEMGLEETLSHTSCKGSTTQPQQQQQQRRSFMGMMSSMFGSRANSTAEMAVSTSDTRQKPKPRPARRKIRRRHVDTNVVSVNLGSLTQDVTLATGDPVFCTHCKAGLSCFSALFNQDGSPANMAAKDMLAKIEERNAGRVQKTDEKASAATILDNASQKAKGSDTSDEFVILRKEEIPKCESEFDLIWKCEFCNTTQALEIEKEEIPTDAILDYVIEMPKSKDGDKESATSDKQIVIFVVDTSGSMCVTTEVDGSFKLKGADEKRAANAGLMAAGDAGIHAQYLPGEKRNITYVSRLQCVQAAVDAQLKMLEKDHPDWTVGLITFNSDVTIYADGSKEPQVIAGSRLDNWEECIARTSTIFAENVFNTNGNISTQHEHLSKKLWAVEEKGPTALGPAVLAAVELASKLKTNGQGNKAKIVLCTDGLANVGIGSLEDSSHDVDVAAIVQARAAQDSAIADETVDESIVIVEGENESANETFYTRLGDHASHLGITIDVLGIASNGCDLENLSALSDKTAGTVSRVSPTELMSNFTGILAATVVATNVEAMVLLHAGLNFRNEGEDVTNKMIRNVGNVTEDTSFSFEYAVLPPSVLAAKGFRNLETLPFQTQITYTRPSTGMICIRIITASKQVTSNMEEAARNLDASVMGSHATQKTAKLAAEGRYQESRINCLTYGKYMARNSHTMEQQRCLSSWSLENSKLERTIAKAQEAEVMDGMQMSSDEEMDGDLGALGFMEAAAAPKSFGVSFKHSAVRKKKHKLKLRARQLRRGKNDDLSSALFKAKKSSSSHYRGVQGVASKGKKAKK